MWDQQENASDPHEIYVTTGDPRRRGDGWVMSATLECDSHRDGGEVALCVSDTARCAYGFGACVDEFERWLNTTLGREYRLDAALAMAAAGPFFVVAGPAGEPTVVLPPRRGETRLAA